MFAVILAFTNILGVLVDVIASEAQSATVVQLVQSSENATVEPVAVVSTSKYWYSVAEYSIAGNPHLVALYVALVVALPRVVEYCFMMSLLVGQFLSTESHEVVTGQVHEWFVILHVALALFFIYTVEYQFIGIVTLHHAHTSVPTEVYAAMLSYE